MALVTPKSQNLIRSYCMTTTYVVMGSILGNAMAYHPVTKANPVTSVQSLETTEATAIASQPLTRRTLEVSTSFSAKDLQLDSNSNLIPSQNFGNVQPTVQLPQGLEFFDTQGHWAQTFIESLAVREIIRGFPDGTFRPEAP
jgi:hypothetical protein